MTLRQLGHWHDILRTAKLASDLGGIGVPVSRLQLHPELASELRLTLKDAEARCLAAIEKEHELQMAELGAHMVMLELTHAIASILSARKIGELWRLHQTEKLKLHIAFLRAQLRLLNRLVSLLLRLIEIPTFPHELALIQRTFFLFHSNIPPKFWPQSVSA